MRENIYVYVIYIYYNIEKNVEEERYGWNYILSVYLVNTQIYCVC